MVVVVVVIVKIRPLLCRKHNLDLKININQNISKLSYKWQEEDAIGLTPSQVQDSNLTKEFKVPQDYRNNEECIRAQGFQLKERIRKGGFSVVYKAIRLLDQLIVACKRMRLTEDEFGVRSEARFANFKNELFILVKHENIISVIHHFILNNDCYIFMEYASGGSLASGLKRRKDPFPQQTVRLYFAQMAKALHHLHKDMAIAHKDLKS